MRGTQEKTKKLLQWHQAFYAGLQIEFQPYMDELTFENEHMLGTKPMQIDVLVVKKSSQVKIKKNIGRIFRTYNIVEYKSPDDYLSTDDFYKVYGYCCFYKSDAIVEDQIPIDELTITFVCYHYPRRMTRHLEEKRGLTVMKQENGIYYIEGDVIPMQLIVVPELSDEKNLWLHSLTNRIDTSETAQRLVDEYEQHRTNRLYESVMDVIVRSNRNKFQEVDSMCQALYELFKDQFEQMAEERAAEIAEQRAAEMAEQRAAEMAEQKVEQMSADIFSDGERATLLSQIEKKIKKRKPLAVIADELEETEDVILPLYNRVRSQLAAQA